MASLVALGPSLQPEPLAARVAAARGAVAHARAGCGGHRPAAAELRQPAARRRVHGGESGQGAGGGPGRRAGGGLAALRQQASRSLCVCWWGTRAARRRRSRCPTTAGKPLLVCVCIIRLAGVGRLGVKWRGMGWCGWMGCGAVCLAAVAAGVATRGHWRRAHELKREAFGARARALRRHAPAVPVVCLIDQPLHFVCAGMSWYNQASRRSCSFFPACLTSRPSRRAPCLTRSSAPSRAQYHARCRCNIEAAAPGCARPRAAPAPQISTGASAFARAAAC